MLHTELPVLDALLADHAGVLGTDFTAYRNHCCRVVNFCAALCQATPDEIEKIQIAVAFHDLGIWTDHTFDYLAPSRLRAERHLAGIGKAEWAAEIGEMISEHHKLRGYHKAPRRLVEAFRKADWLDVSLGLIGFGLPRAFRREVRMAFPNAGFHKRLVQLASRRLLTHPLSPMPMLRW